MVSSAISYCYAPKTLKKFVVLPIAMTKVSYFSVRAGNNAMPSSSCADARVMVFALLSSAIRYPSRYPPVYRIAVGKYDFGFFAFSKPVAQPRGKFESARAASDNEDLMHHAPASSIFHEFHAFAPSLASGRGEAPVSVCLKSAKLLFN